jgi:predicted ABC-type ATPase
MGCRVQNPYTSRPGGTIASSRPHVVVLAGPNGAGKSTAAPWLLKGALGVTEFVNADDIAKGLSAFDPEGVAISAGKIMLTRLRELALRRENFAFETTLASRSFAPWLKELISSGYRFYLTFLYLDSANLACQRVKARVKAGGHSVPEDVIRRRYENGLRNFFRLYTRLATAWLMYNASSAPRLSLIASRSKRGKLWIKDHETWRDLSKKYAQA